jgi:hypothetical protein
MGLPDLLPWMLLSTSGRQPILAVGGELRTAQLYHNVEHFARTSIIMPAPLKRQGAWLLQPRRLVKVPHDDRTDYELRTVVLAAL